ncbi:MAG: hypothetical protein H7336_06450 [Bacteriovorax sp.]|nr:hypothetical protein [Bacteriovorax sp.]
MCIEENLNVRSSQNDQIKDLKKELEKALAVMKNYEDIIAILKLESSNNPESRLYFSRLFCFV